MYPDGDSTDHEGGQRPWQMAPTRPSERDNRECPAGAHELTHAAQGGPGIGEMVQGGIGHDGVEAAQSFARVEDVSERPGHLGVGEALLGPLQNRTVDIHSDDVRNALRQASGQKPVAAANFEHRRHVGWNGRVKLAVVVDVDVPRFCHESSLADLSDSARINAYVRTENDTWDITTSVGSTALFVAAARALEAQKPNPVAIDPYAEVFCRAAGGDWAHVLDGANDHPLKSEFGEHFVNFQGARTRYFDNYFQAAAAAGVRQIVLLAAGLDSRGHRLPWPDGTVVFELDQPRVLEFKREVIARHGDAPTAERREVAVDLRNDWPQALRDSGFDPSKPSAWIAEGLLIYLPAAAQQQLFAGIDSLAAPGSHLAVEEAVPLDADSFEAKRQEELAGGNDRTFFTLVYNEQHAPAHEFFGARGWWAVSTPLPYQLRSLGRPVPAADTEAGFMTGNISLVSAIKD
jgi:methyltransferase (TIGR00027 family)